MAKTRTLDINGDVIDVETEGDCENCRGHRFLFWMQKVRHSDERLTPLLQSCQICNSDGELRPPTYPVVCEDTWDKPNGTPNA